MLVFVHGMWGNAGMWNDFIKHFSNRNFSCRAINLKEGLNLYTASFEDYVNKVKKIVGEDDVVIGHSMGGLIVQKLAEETKIRGGIGICPAPPRGIKFKIKISYIKFLPKIVAKKPFKPDFSFSKKLYLNCLSEEEARNAYEKLEEDSPVVSYELAMNKISVDEGRVKCPMLFIATKEDKASPPEMVKKIAEKYKAEYEIYEGCHWIFTNWRDIADSIERFVIKLYEK